jgi:hypothetical protein
MAWSEVIYLLTSASIAVIIAALATTVVASIWMGRIDLTYLLSEAACTVAGETPKASLSRFQALVFTFVIAGLYLVLCLRNNDLLEIKNGPLILLGITSATYLGGKAISAQKDEAEKQAPPPKPDDPATAAKAAAYDATSAAAQASDQAAAAKAAAEKAQQAAAAQNPDPQ